MFQDIFLSNLTHTVMPHRHKLEVSPDFRFILNAGRSKTLLCDILVHSKTLSGKKTCFFSCEKCISCDLTRKNFPCVINFYSVFKFFIGIIFHKLFTVVLFKVHKTNTKALFFLNAYSGLSVETQAT